jgi:hypothetical protein
MMKSKLLLWLGVIPLCVAIFTAVPSSASAQTVLTACGTITSSGNYVLKTNLSTSGDCFVIAADNVAIDMKGHTIKGDGTGSGITDSNVRHPYLIVSNGKIQNFNMGINLENSGLATFNKLQVTNNTAGGIYVDQCCNTFNSIKANNNGGAGLENDGCCSVLTKVQTNGNGGAGMELYDCCYSITGGTAKNNGGIGIDAEGCCSAIHDALATGNASHGIYVNDCCNFVLSSKSNKNGADGVFGDNSVGCCAEDNLVSNTQANGNADDGIELLTYSGFTGGYNLVSSSKANHNGGVGVKLDDAEDNQAVNVTATKNNVGVSLLCPGTALNVKANGNSGGNFLTSGGTCTTLNTP